SNEKRAGSTLTQNSYLDHFIPAGVKAKGFKFTPARVICGVGRERPQQGLIWSPTRVDWFLAPRFNEFSVFGMRKFFVSRCLRNLAQPYTLGRCNRAGETQQPLEFQVVFNGWGLVLRRH